MRRESVLVVLAVAACGRPAAPAPASRAALADSVAAMARRFLEANQLPGLAVGVWDRDTVLYQGGFGVTALPDGAPVTPATIFHLASVTKPFVATAVMQLVDEGKVGLDEPVAKYVPYFTMKDPRAARITIRQLLNHSAGMPDVTDYRWDHPEYDAGALERYLRGLKDSTLIAAPGQRVQYSNIGFELLAEVVAKVRGQPFETVIQERILTPLGMAKSTLLMTDVDSSLMAFGHGRDSAGYHRYPDYPYNRRHAGSSTLHSNVTDMLRWARANLGRGELGGARILPAAAYDELWRPARDVTADLTAEAKKYGIAVPFDSIAVGLSWFLLQRHGQHLVDHSGADHGFRSDLMLAPGQGVGIVVLVNGEAADPWQLSTALMDLLLAPRPR